MYRYESVADYNVLNQQETLHPLVSVIDFSKADLRDWGGAKQVKQYFGIYCIVLKQVKCGDLKYGLNYYDYQEGTLVFISPGQVLEIETDGRPYQPMGHGLVFHPDLTYGTALAENLSKYSFFSYDTREALHISQQEKQIILDCFTKIDHELRQGLDKHSKKLIAANIDLFLSYCERFYDRQFLTRDKENKGVLERFEALLSGYFLSEKPKKLGLPSVTYFAEQLHLSPNYFGDLIKKQTGQSAQEYIQAKIIRVAKERIFDPEKSLSEIAYELGFKYPQHFTRLFKKRTGKTPNEFRLQD